MNLTYKIVETATEMFIKRGVKSVNVDEISAELGISKRTLYEQVKSKEELLSLSIQFFASNCKKRFNEIFERNISVFERIVSMIETQLNILRSTNKNFIDELVRYSKDNNKKTEEANLLHRTLFINLINEGQKNGDIKDELSAEILAKILESQVKALGSSTFYDFSKVSFFDVYYTLWSVYLNGIATEKGREILKTVKI